MLEMHQVVYRHQASSFELFVQRLTLKPGITLLVGPNGAGKSSLLQLLATARFPDSGIIRYDGLGVERDLAAIRARIGFVPSGVELYEQMTVAKLLRYFAELKGGLAAGELEWLIESFHLGDYRSLKIKTLAQGVRQRVALAQAWIASPSFLFLDEPLNALDTLERLHFTRFVAAHSRSRTIVVSTHEMNEWEAWADHVLWFEDGIPCFYGTAEEWINGLPVSVWTGSVAKGAYRRYDPAHLLHIRPEDGYDELRLLGSRCPGAGFEPALMTLEDAYFIRCRYRTGIVGR
ncbi:ABC transporter ATP-binding protein [Paenibacillus methanolicus]|uniref:ABC transporter family protein n=1 Tax=Paenibacillus methanolicus TaxID=582686 RepID=A0A5S5BRX6_9BACL|nr:ABC transporter ATP-binding protein [Paenibacillus methanolicus]TYP69747.1 ABC transporter family protein [Paenibacillus methanolicus]